MARTSWIRCIVPTVVGILFSTSVAAQDALISRELIASTSGAKKIEYYWTRPEGKGPFPMLVMIHPDQKSPKIGGKAFVEYGQLGHWRQKGFVVVAVSQPGYGGSEGRSDFCGPKTQAAVLEVVRHFQRLPEVDADRVFLYGGSRGAVVASMLATKGLKLKGVILKSGVYDFVDWSERTPWYDDIRLQMLWEMGWVSTKKLRERSAYFFADQIRVPVLFIHGTHDARAPIGLVEKFVAKIQASGGTATLIQVSADHVISMNEVDGMIEEFILKQR